ncbi:MAG: iron ABC transporter permease [Alphaproteobacteria bacterium]|nr:iron ABC transporter permease [Alphaproteobacteria bacterium]
MTDIVDNSGVEDGASKRYLRTARKRSIIVFVMMAIVAFSVLLDVSLGPGNFPLSDIIDVLWDENSHGVSLSVIVWDIRLPVALMALLIGAMLGAAGAEMQTILNNPLADPFTLGISSAASFGASLAIVAGFSLIPYAGTLLITTNAFGFALLASFILFATTRMRGVNIETMVLVGIALMFTFNALLALMQYYSSETELQKIVFWMMGSLMRVTWSKLAICAVILGISLPIFMWRNWQLTALRLGDEKARSMGINVSRLRIEMLILVSLLSAVSVAFVGVIGFIGLVGPHMARMMVGEDQRFFLPMSVFCGALILSVASIISKMITPGIIYPIGMITSLIGVPFFLSLVLKQRKRSW